MRWRAKSGGRGGARRSHLPPGRGRGSSVSSIICYLIGLSHIDPIRNNLFIGRFLNEEMHSLPDIDLDFPRDIRAELIERVYETWGKEHAALVAIFPTYRLRSAIRDVGKVLGLPATELDRLAKRSSPYDHLSELPAELARHPEFADRVESPGWRHLSELAQQLAGMPRHLSQHVGGMVISSTPLIDYVPVPACGLAEPLPLPLGQGLDRRRADGEDRLPRAGHALGRRGIGRD